VILNEEQPQPVVEAFVGVVDPVSNGSLLYPGRRDEMADGTGAYRREIEEIPGVIRRQGEWLVGPGAAELRAASDAVRGGRRCVVVGMGSSLFVGLALETWCGRGGVPVTAIDASRLLTGAPTVLPEDRLVLVSQSGRTEEVLAWLDVIAGRQRVIAVTADPDSPLARAADIVLPLQSGKETASASKSFVATLTLADLLGRALTGAAVAPDRLEMSALAAEAALEARAPDALRAPWPGQTWHAGEGAALAVACQAGLLVSETTSVPAVGLGVGALRHGPIESLSEGHLVVIYGDGEPSRYARLLEATAAAAGSRVVFARGHLAAPQEQSVADLVAQAVAVNLLTEQWALAEGRDPGVLTRMARPADPASSG
jgi:glucosamine--fructose-6-phosphate aminotransferase (isomerizing)